MVAATTVYLRIPGDGVYGLYQAPDDGRPRGTSVLICPPWGWDEAAAYRSLRTWSEQLGAAGHPSLRIDMPSTGDSGGMPLDPGRVEAWLDAIDAGAEWLRGKSGGGRVALLGIGLGGLLARAACARRCPAEDLILWGAPADARAFLRAQRAFNAMQSWGGDPDASAPLPEGALEAGGSVLSAETKADLGSLATAPTPGAAPARALLLDRDGIAVEAAIAEGLEAAGTEVAAAPGPGYGTLVSHPEKSRLSEEVAATVADWLVAGPTDSASAPGVGEPPSAGFTPAVELASLADDPTPPATVTLDLGAVRERPWTMEQDFGRLYGVLAEPVAGATTDTCAIFFNAGATRNIGPNRMWVETARRWAARGVSVLRVDLEAIGESDGDETRFHDVGEFYVPAYAGQIALLLAELRRQGVGQRFLLAGLCAGAYWSFVAAQDLPEVSTVLMLNPAALIWDPDVVAEREFRKLSRLLSWRWWKKLLSGGIRRDGAKILLELLAQRAAGALRRLGRRLTRRGEDPIEDIDAALDRVRDNGVRVALAFSGEEALHAELERAGVLAKIDRWPNVELAELPFADHSLRPIAAQVGARAVIDRELELLLA